MGAVYSASAEGDTQEVAIKFLFGPFTDDPEFLTRMRQEARVIASLENPHIVRLLEYREEADIGPCLVMERAMGENLRQLLTREAPLALPLALSLAAQTAEALAHAHQRQVVHRDIKPENLVVDDDGRLVVTDFGICRAAGGSQVTRTGFMPGTPAYMAPEQLSPGHVGPAADLYALGTVLYEMLTGRTPFQSEHIAEVIHRQAYQIPTPPSALRSEISPQLDSLVLACLAKNPENRPPSAQALATALRGLAQFSPPAPATPGPLPIYVPDQPARADGAPNQPATALPAVSTPPVPPGPAFPSQTAPRQLMVPPPPTPPGPTFPSQTAPNLPAIPPPPTPPGPAFPSQTAPPPAFAPPPPAPPGSTFTSPQQPVAPELGPQLASVPRSRCPAPDSPARPGLLRFLPLLLLLAAVVFLVLAAQRLARPPAWFEDGTGCAPAPLSHVLAGATTLHGAEIALFAPDRSGSGLERARAAANNLASVLRQGTPDQVQGRVDGQHWSISIPEGDEILRVDKPTATQLGASTTLAGSWWLALLKDHLALRRGQEPEATKAFERQHPLRPPDEMPVAPLFERVYLRARHQVQEGPLTTEALLRAIESLEEDEREAFCQAARVIPCEVPTGTHAP